MSSKEQTLVLIKPDGVMRGLVGEIFRRLEVVPFHLAGMKMIKMDRTLAEKHYAEHQGKEFYESLLEFITSGPVICMVLEGEGIIQKLRDLIGATDPEKAKPGTIRGDLAESITRNLIHASDSSEKARREISLFFSPEEIFSQG
ncbi:MAG: nucleoside-diphosphate kinase [bacterium JZ-2024 1]